MYPNRCPEPSVHTRGSGLPIAALFLAGGLLLAPAARSAGPAGEDPTVSQDALVRAGTETISVAEFESELRRRGRGLPGQYADPESRRALLDEMIRERLLIAAAREAGYASDPALVRAFEQLMATQYRRDHLEAVLEATTVSDEEVQAWYDGHPELYAVPRKVQAALIRIDLPAGMPERKQDQRRRRAEEALERARDLPPEATGFGALAQEYSEDTASRYVGGVIGWLSEGRRHRWPEPVTDALFALASPGDLDGVVEADGSLWIVRLVDARDGSVRPLESVQDGIRHELTRQQMQRERERFFRKLAAAHKVQVDEARLAAIAAPATPDPRDSPPPAAPTREAAGDGTGQGERE